MTTLDPWSPPFRVTKECGEGGMAEHPKLVSGSAVIGGQETAVFSICEVRGIP
jgi:hypothetical protein